MAHDRVGFRSDPNGRGTMTVISNCLFTWFICLWTIYHTNCPASGDRNIVLLVRKATLMLYLSVFPEFVLLNSFTQWREAKLLSMEMRSLDAEPISLDPYGLIRSQTAPALLQSWGDVNRMIPLSTSSTTCAARANQVSHIPEPWTFMHSLSCVSGIYVIWLPEENRHCPLNRKQLIWALKNNCVERPNLRRQELEARSKSDSFLKAISILQTVFFIVQCIARAIQKLPITTLEVATIGYIGCTLPSLYFWWEKPYDVTCPIELPIKHWPRNACEELRRNGDDWVAYVWLVGRHRLEEQLPSRLYNQVRIESPNAPKRPSTKALWDVNNYGVLLLGGLIFGALHMIAWNFGFATGYEKWFWRASSILIISTACFGLLDIWFDNLVSEKELFKVIRLGVERMGLFLYTLSRIYLMVEVFLAFRSMPREVYETIDWNLYVPSF